MNEQFVIRSGPALGMIQAVSNKKGGSAKTTSVVNLAEAYARMGFRVLVVDLDAQANATAAFGIKEEQGNAQLQAENSLYDLFIGAKVDVRKMILPSNRTGLKLDVIPAVEYLESLDVVLLQRGIVEGVKYGKIQGAAAAENKPVDPPEKEGELVASMAKAIFSFLSERLEVIRPEYDFILIDCPPGYSVVTGAALLSCDCVLVTLDSSYWAYVGGSKASNYFEKISELFDKQVRILGYLLCRYQQRLNNHQNVRGWLEQNFPDDALETSVRECAAFSRIAYQAKSLWSEKGKSREVAADYECVAVELLKRLQIDIEKRPEVTEVIQ